MKTTPLLTGLLLVSLAGLASAQDFDQIKLRTEFHGTHTLVVKDSGEVSFHSRGVWHEQTSTATIGSLAAMLPDVALVPDQLPVSASPGLSFRLEVIGGSHPKTITGDRYSLGRAAVTLEPFFQLLRKITPLGPEVAGGVLKGVIRNRSGDTFVETEKGVRVKLDSATGRQLREFRGLPVHLEGKSTPEEFSVDKTVSPTRFAGKVTLERDSSGRLVTKRGGLVVRAQTVVELVRSLQTLYNVHDQRELDVEGWVFESHAPLNPDESLYVEKLYATAREGVRDVNGGFVRPGKRVEVNLMRILTTTIQVRAEASDRWAAVQPDLISFPPRSGIITLLPR
ncbi:MAG TPA: hypothetical protein DEA08_02600 [Planctomycetes bacterium]|nr:hypothetical protein [Planctomycetota bacterium]